MHVLRLVCSALLFSPIALCRGFNHLRKREIVKRNPQDFKWTSITPKSHLEYHPCYDGFQCARLQVPMNYNATTSHNTTNSQANQTIALGILRVPAHVPVTDPRYGGAILINPGGPGASGVEAAQYDGRALQTVLDAAYANNSDTYVVNSTSAKYFDIIGWDPRALDFTTPFYSCQQSPAAQIVQFLQRQTNLLTTPEGNYDYIWSQFSSLNQGCAYDPVTNPHGSEIIYHASTTYVALDMIQIIEKHGIWREQQAQNPEQRARLRYTPGEEPLLYAGGSYGTDLGQVFASMQPHRVHRMFLDGVDNAVDAISGTLKESLWDADAVMENCYYYCALAGPEKCGLYNGPNANDTRARVMAIMRDLEEDGPVFVPRHGSVDANVVSLSDVFEQSYLMLFNPVVSFEGYTNAMGPLQERNGTAFVDAYKANVYPIFMSDTYEAPSSRINTSDPGSDTHQWASTSQITNAISCPEAWVRRNKTEYKQFVNYCQNQSYWGAPTFTTTFVKPTSPHLLGPSADLPREM